MAGEKSKAQGKQSKLIVETLPTGHLKDRESGGATDDPVGSVPTGHLPVGGGGSSGGESSGEGSSGGEGND